MIEVLHRAHLILGSEQRHDRRGLAHEHHAVPIFEHGDRAVAAAPVLRQLRAGANIGLRLSASCFFLQALRSGPVRVVKRIRAQDRLARIVELAVAPCGGSRRILADDFQEHRRDRPMLRLDRLRAVAAVVARIGPERAILVKVLRREEIHGQRLDAWRGGAAPRGSDDEIGIAASGATDQRDSHCADERVALHLRSHSLQLGGRCAARNGFARRRMQCHRERRAAAYALEPGIGNFLGLAMPADENEQRGQRDGETTTARPHSPLAARYLATRRHLAARLHLRPPR